MTCPACHLPIRPRQHRVGPYHAGCAPPRRPGRPPGTTDPNGYGDTHTTTVGVRLRRDELRDLDTYAQRRGETRTEAARDAIRRVTRV